MSELYAFLEHISPVLMLLAGIFVPPWVKTVIRAELKEPVEKLDDLDGRMAVMEHWQSTVASDVRAIPSAVAILERLERTMNRTDTTLSQLNETMRDVSVRLARIEGPQR